MSSSSRKIITTNRKASYNYNLLDTYDAGLILMGSEIKSIRNNRINIQDGFVQERAGELWLHNVHISPYEQAHHFGHHDPLRPRKLLLHRKQIAQIISRIRERGISVVPTQVFLEKGRAKVTIALAQGKKLYDKRADIAKRDSDRQIQRALKGQHE
jgi:SsrA-binding protein